MEPAAHAKRAGTQIKAVLFDLDGTLLHTSPDLAAAASAALRECGYADIDPARVEQFVGKGIDVLVQRCLRHIGEADNGPVFEKMCAAYMRHYEALNGVHATPYDGVFEGLDALRAAGYQLGVCTNKTARFTQPLLERCNMAHYFDVVVSGDTTARKKPHPDMIEYAANRWGTRVSEILFIGDSGNDTAAARAAGCPVWVVPYGYNEGEPVQNLDCDGIVATLLEAAQRLPVLPKTSVSGKT
jgi:phosphoglycolate phosphatase